MRISGEFRRHLLQSAGHEEQIGAAAASRAAACLPRQGLHAFAVGIDAYAERVGEVRSDAVGVSAVAATDIDEREPVRGHQRRDVGLRQRLRPVSVENVPYCSKNPCLIYRTLAGCITRWK